MTTRTVESSVHKDTGGLQFIAQTKKKMLINQIYKQV